MFDRSRRLARAWFLPGLIAASLAACTSQPAPPVVSVDAAADPAVDTGATLSPDAARADIALARRTLELLHPGYTRYTSAEDLDAAWSALDAAVADGISRERLAAEVSRTIAAIKCEHTKLEIASDMEEARNTAPVYLPFRSVMFDGRLYVDRPGPGTGLARGDEITAVDGRDISAWFDEIAPLISVDGDNAHAKPGAFAFSMEYQGGAFDHFAALLGPVPAEARLEVQSADGSTREIDAARITYAEYEAVSGVQRFSRNFSDDDAVTLTPVGDTAAILTVTTFVNYRTPVDPDAVYGPLFATMKAENRSTLIVDLRQNGGGSDDAQYGLARRLITAPVETFKPARVAAVSIPEDVRVHLSTWNPAALNPDPAMFEPAPDGLFQIKNGGAPALTPSDDAFTGEVIVLTGPSNASGVTHLLAVLRASGRGVFIGERTGGAPTGATAGTLAFLTLPESQLRVRVPLLRTVIEDDALPTRHGLDPDVAAPLTAEAYFADRDPAMEAAIERARAGETP